MLRAPSLSRERLAWAESRLLVGVDEAGRGPLAGPVVAAAVVFPPETRRINGIRDSKTISRDDRETLAMKIRSRAIRLGVGAASCREIDRLNIRVASALAMRRAVVAALRAGTSELGSLGARERQFPQLSSSLASYALIIDGLPLPELGYSHEALVDGDAHCYSVAAASIVAKTVRDRIMRCLANRHPAYGWATNVGYGTPEHLAGLSSVGPTRHHRMTFAPCVQRELWSGC
jgi:ribonuclease HII